MNTKIRRSDLFFLQDNRLSLAAKGLLMYLLVNPEERYANCEDWLVDANNTPEEMKMMLHELIQFEYVVLNDQHLSLPFVCEKKEMLPL